MRRFARLPLWIKIGAIMTTVAIAIVVIAGLVFAMNPGPKQPIPFSHRIHVYTKQLNCFFCHPTAGRSKNAGVPSVEKCMLCHKVIASQFRPIKKIIDHYDRKETIPWVRVNRLPEFTHFSHQSHITRGIDCGQCHGNVMQMDRIKQVHKFSMRFCIDCHTQNKAPIVCFTCHY
jgi:hypothetical protein